MRRVSRQKGERAHRPGPDRSRQAGQQAPPSRRCRRHSPRRCPDPGERPRQSDAGADARCGDTDPPVPGSAPPATGQAARRQGLRFSALPPGLPRAPHRPAHRQTRCRHQRAPRPAPPAGAGRLRSLREGIGPGPMGGRANLRLARPRPPPRRPLRATSRHLRGFPPSRRGHDLLQIRRAMVLLGALILHPGFIESTALPITVAGVLLMGDTGTPYEINPLASDPLQIVISRPSQAIPTNTASARVVPSRTSSSSRPIGSLNFCRGTVCALSTIT